ARADRTADLVRGRLVGSRPAVGPGAPPGARCAARRGAAGGPGRLSLLPPDHVPAQDRGRRVAEARRRLTPRDKLRIGARIAAAKLRAVPRPFFVQYSLLNACNARCGYCNCPNREDPQLTLEQHRRVLGEFARL